MSDSCRQATQYWFFVFKPCVLKWTDLKWNGHKKAFILYPTGNDPAPIKICCPWWRWKQWFESNQHAHCFGYTIQTMISIKSKCALAWLHAPVVRVNKRWVWRLHPPASTMYLYINTTKYDASTIRYHVFVYVQIRHNTMKIPCSCI